MTATLGKIAADFSTTLNLKTAIGATSATLDSATDDDGVALPTGTYFLTLDRKSANKEYIKCTLTSTALTDIYHVSRQGALTSGTTKTHRKGATVEITDFAIIKKMLDLLDGTTDLNASVPLKYDGTATISNANHLATKAYVDGVAIAGGADASTTVKGISKLSYAPASASDPIAVGDNDPRVPTTGENDALAGAGGSPSSSNLYETQYDTSNGATKTATTISFTSGTKTIADSGNGFVTAGFKQGTQITITGSASNNGTFTIVSVAAGAIVVAESLVTEAAGATVVMTTVTANKLLRLDANGEISNIAGIITIGSIFGMGADGAVTFDGSTTILGLVPAGNIYTMTQDIHCTNITINNGVTVKPAGYRIYATGTLTNNGTISNNGGNGGNAANSSASTPGTVGAAGATAVAGVTVFSSGGAGTAGAIGKTTNSSGNAATSPTSVTNAVAGAGGSGGAGGGVENGGGAGGSSTATTSGTDGIKDLITATTFYTIAGVVKAGTAGGGGGGGGNYIIGSVGTGAGGSGGGGGGAGGVVYISTKSLAGAGSITATGGNGGTGGNSFLGTATGVRLGGGGGGGGGAGGVVIVITKTSTNPNTISVAGGTGGAGGTGVKEGLSGTTADGSSGSTGTTGQSVYFVI